MRWENSDPDLTWPTRQLTPINMLQVYQFRSYWILKMTTCLIMRSLGKVECLFALVEVWAHDRICSTIHSSRLNSISLGRTEAS
jgi:hypothetical protein